MTSIHGLIIGSQIVLVFLLGMNILQARKNEAAILQNRVLNTEIREKVVLMWQQREAGLTNKDLKEQEARKP